MPIVPRYAMEHAYKTSGNGWKVFSSLCKHRNIETGKCNPSHETIARESGVEITGVSKAKKELRDLGWIQTRGKWDVIILVGIDEFERARESYLANKARSQAQRFTKGGAILGKSQDAAGDVGEFPVESWENSGAILKDGNSSERDAAAAATTASVSRSISKQDAHAWKQETVTTEFLAELVTRGLFSEQVVNESWQELAFAVAQRGPDARAVKGELMAFCRAKQKTMPMPHVAAEVVKLDTSRASGTAGSTGGVRECDSTCPLCLGGQMQIVPGKGARPCPNRVAASGDTGQINGATQ